MQWAEIDLAARLWTLPAQRSKNRRENQIPLSPQAVAILESLPRFDGCDYVFTISTKAPLNDFLRGKRRLDALMRAEIPGLPRWTLHDLRRTAASGMAGLGIAPHVVEAILNHRSGVISRRRCGLHSLFVLSGETRRA